VDREYPVRIIRSARKTISLQISPEGEVIVRCPKRISKTVVQEIIKSREKWIFSHLQKLQERPIFPPLTDAELAQLRREAMEDLQIRTTDFASRMGVRYERITIRCQRTRWGSCSGKGNINYNCLLMLAPPFVRDYVVVHELCHRRELNHSAAFWHLVEASLPDYRKGKAWLKENGTALMGRLPTEKRKK